MTKRFTLDWDDFGIQRMFTEEGYEFTDNPEEAHFTVFCGGADVNPSYYGEEKHPYTTTSSVRDKRSMALSLYSRPRVGICRGSQFLCVRAGHKLHQHIHNHAFIHEHLVEDLTSGETASCTSTHHQAMRFAPRTKEAELSKVLAVAHQPYVGHSEMQIEAMWHPHINALGFQPHPEYRNKSHSCRVMFMRYFDEYIKGML